MSDHAEISYTPENGTSKRENERIGVSNYTLTKGGGCLMSKRGPAVGRTNLMGGRYSKRRLPSSTEIDRQQVCREISCAEIKHRTPMHFIHPFTGNHQTFLRRHSSLRCCCAAAAAGISNKLITAIDASSMPTLLPHSAAVDRMYDRANP